jgi:hypothetical protein
MDQEQDDSYHGQVRLWHCIDEPIQLQPAGRLIESIEIDVPYGQMRRLKPINPELIGFMPFPTYMSGYIYFPNFQVSATMPKWV